MPQYCEEEWQLNWNDCLFCFALPCVHISQLTVMGSHRCNGMWKDVPKWCFCSSRSETWAQPVQLTSPFPVGKREPFFQCCIANAHVSRALWASLSPLFWTVFRSRFSVCPTHIWLCQIPFYLSIYLAFISIGLIPALLTFTVETELDSEAHTPFY